MRIKDSCFEEKERGKEGRKEGREKGRWRSGTTTIRK